MNKPKNLFEAVMELERIKSARPPRREEIEKKAAELAAAIGVEDIKRRVSEMMKKEDAE